MSPSQVASYRGYKHVQLHLHNCLDIPRSKQGRVLIRIVIMALLRELLYAPRAILLTSRYLKSKPTERNRTTSLIPSTHTHILNLYSPLSANLA